MASPTSARRNRARASGRSWTTGTPRRRASLRSAAARTPDPLARTTGGSSPSAPVRQGHGEVGRVDHDAGGARARPGERGVEAAPLGPQARVALVLAKVPLELGAGHLQTSQVAVAQEQEVARAGGGEKGEERTGT